MIGPVKAFILFTAILLSVAQVLALCNSPQWALYQQPQPSLVQYQTFFSPTLGADASFGIYLPAQYHINTGGRYAVLYWLHGGGSTLISGEDFVNRLDDAIARGITPPFIVVLPNGPDTL